MSRPSGPKTRCGGEWTEARFNSFIKSGLRQLSRKWAPIHDTKKNARVRRGIYLCDECKEEVPASIRIDGKRENNAIVDHTIPIIDPHVGFTTWDECIQRMFCEEDNLQLNCRECHNKKSLIERTIAAETRRNKKNGS